MIDLEWKVVYVGSAESSSHDQTLDEVLVGPIPVGVNKFVLQADSPDSSSIPQGDILGVTVVLVTCSYRDQEFARIGYYVNNEYQEEFDPETGPPLPLDMNKISRQILADKPRVTRFPIDWSNQGDIEKFQLPEGSQEENEIERNKFNECSDMDLGNRGNESQTLPAVISPLEQCVEDNQMIIA